MEKLLGYFYNTNTDCIKIAANNIDKNSKTKRGILSQISSVFYPLSLCLPVSIRRKLLLRELWKRKFDWDQELSDDIIKFGQN